MIADFMLIMRSGLFMHSAYANRYLGSRIRLWQSLAHYVLVGEANGNLPNAFFDPAFARQQGVRGLAAYLRDSSLWTRALSVHFDPAHYAATADTNPLADFHKRGFARNRHPSASFDTAFFKQVVAFYRPDKEEFAYEFVTSTAEDLVTNERRRVAKVQAFFDTIKLVVLRSPTKRRRFLLFVQGSRAFRDVHASPHRSFDVLLNDYAAPTDLSSANYDPALEWVTTQNGTKTSAIRKLLTDAPHILTGYEFVLFLDDDVILTTAEIDRLFAVADSHHLDLAQASLTADSHCAFDTLKQPRAGSGLTPLTGVEIMMPVVSRRALQECGWVFAEGVSGWGVDFLLGAAVRERFGNTIALIGDVVARHETPIDTTNGAFYSYLRAHGIEATTEAGSIASRYGIEVSEGSIRRHPAALGTLEPA